MRARGGSSQLIGKFFQGSIRRPSYLLRRNEDGSGGKNGEWENIESEAC